jgi:putative transcriptional regulator
MKLIRFARLLSVVLAALFLPASLLNAGLSPPEEAPTRPSLAGQLLVASREMGDPRFYHAVILVVRHDRNGALGIVINRPVEDRSLASLLEALGEKDTAVAGSVRIFAGGPVQPEIGFVLHSTEYHRPETFNIDGRVAMTSSPQILRDIGSRQGPNKSLIAFGYAGWRPDQLEGELRQRAWFTAADDEKLIFDEDRDKLWEEAIKRRTQDL